MTIYDLSNNIGSILSKSNTLLLIDDIFENTCLYNIQENNKLQPLVLVNPMKIL